MSPLKRKKLSKIRIELDKLDNSLIKIIKKRTNLVKKVLELKDKKNQIIDQKRINIILISELSSLSNSILILPNFFLFKGDIYIFGLSKKYYI